MSRPALLPPQRPRPCPLTDDPDFCVNAYQSNIPWDQNPTSAWGAAGVNAYHCDWVIDTWTAIVP